MILEPAGLGRSALIAGLITCRFIAAASLIRIALAEGVCENSADPAVKQTTLLARLGDYSLFQGRLPDTVAGPSGAAQRAKYELRRNKAYDPISQALPAMKIVTDAVGVQH